MPRSKAIDSYPAEYFQLIEQAQETAMHIPCISPEEATNMRNQLYVFRLDLLRSGKEEFANFIMQARALRFRIEGSTLIIERNQPKLVNRIQEILT